MRQRNCKTGALSSFTPVPGWSLTPTAPPTGGAGKLLTDGGRVLAVTATGDNFAKAVADAYRAVDDIHFEDAVWRTDIGLSAARASARVAPVG